MNILKKTLKIAGRIAVGLLITIYIAIAAVNYSVVQSYLGTAAGRYFSQEWGAEVHVGSLHATPWDHLILHDVLLVSPTNDTIFRGESLRVRFRHFPFSQSDTWSKLDLDRVYIENAYYHFEKYLNREYGGEGGINLNFIINYYKIRHKEKTPPSGKTFTVNVRSLTLKNIHYKMDLPDHGRPRNEHGVDIQHMEFLDINGRFRNVHVVKNDITVRIVKLSTRERSGFTVFNLSGDTHVSPQDITVRNLAVETPQSKIMLDSRMTYHYWMPDYIHDVEHEVEIKHGTTVAMSEVAYWAPILWGVDVQLQLEGSAYGKIDNLTTDGLWVGYGGASNIAVAGNINGLPDIDNTNISIDHLNVKLEESDIRHLESSIPQFLPSKVTKYLRQAEYIDLQANGNGYLNGVAAANINLACGLGNLKSDIAIKKHGTGRYVTVEANSNGMALSILGMDWLTHSGLALSANAYLPRRVRSINDIDGEATLELTNSVIKGNRLSPIEISCRIVDGKAEMEATSSDTLLAFDAECVAELRGDTRKYQAEVSLNNFNASAFGLTSNKNILGRTRLIATASGNSIDELTGTLVARDSRWGVLQLRELRLDVDADASHKTMRFESDPISASAYGNFAYADIPIMVRHMLSTILPADIKVTEAPDSVTLAKISNNSLNFNVQWNDDGKFLKNVTDKVKPSRGTRLSGSYNSGELLKMVMRSDSIRFGSILLSDIGLSSRMAGEDYIIELESQDAIVGKLNLLSNLNLNINSNSRHASLGLVWGEKSDNRGDLMLKLQDGLVSVEKPYLYINGTRWALGLDSLAIYLDDNFRLAGNEIQLSSDKQRVAANVRLLKQSNDCLELNFDHFDLAGISTMLLQTENLSIAGNVNGRFNLYGLGEIPFFNANLKIDSCIVNQQALGNVAVRSNWNAELNTMNLQLQSNQIDAHGWLGLGRKDPDLNFAVTFDSLDLSLAAPFITAFSSRFEGLLHGQFDIGGTTSSPIVVGEALVENGVLKVDQNGVTYHFGDSIRFASNIITLDNFKVLDPYGNPAYLDGTIRYKNLQDAVFDIALQTDNLLVYDRNDDERFNGTVLAAATGNVGGSSDNINIVIDARTMPGCNITVPVNNRKHVKSQNYISFVSDKPEKNIITNGKGQHNKGINIELDLSITPDLKMNLPMDFSEVAVTVGANGNGDIHLSYDGRQSPQVLGNYEITNGNMKLSLLSVVDKNFTIESGSNLNFQGSLPDARFDLKAVYSQRVNLSTLTGSLSTIDNTQKYIQVENVIAVNGTIQDPTIGFDLRLPNADQSVEDEVFAYIDRNSERDMLNQTLTLLVSGNFYNVSGNDQGNAGASGLGTIASTLGGMMADMVNIVDINVDYRAATEMTNQQLDLNISKDWGRWYLESTLGYGGESRELESNTTVGTVLDALVGYRISPLVHLYAYNRTNTNDYTRMDLPYKQGVGLKLTKDFDRWSDLFKRKNKKADKKK